MMGELSQSIITKEYHMARPETAGQDYRVPVLSHVPRDYADDVAARARALGVSEEEVREQDLEILQSVPIPTACLTPDEVWYVVRGQLTGTRLEHARTCDGCRILIEMAKPDPELARRMGLVLTRKL
jgi:hypothetical protein